MIAASILLLLICGTITPQTSNAVQTSTKTQMDYKTIVGAKEGNKLLVSLVESLEPESVPHLNEFSVLVTDVAAALSPISALFALPDKLKSTDKPSDLELVVETIRQLNVTFVSIKTKLAFVSNYPTYPIYSEYNKLEYDLESWSGKFTALIGDVQSSEQKEDFIKDCNGAENNPQDLLNRLYHLLMVANDGSIIDPLYTLMLGTNNDYRVLKLLYQVVVKDFIRTAMVHQACLGITNANRFLQHKAAKEAQNKLGEISAKIRKMVAEMVKRPTKDDFDAEVNDMLEQLKNQPNENVTYQIKQFLQEKYFWLLWNVYMSRTDSGRLYRKEKSTNTLSLYDAYNHVVISWGNTESYLFKKDLLFDVKNRLQNMFASKTCTEVRDEARNEQTFLSQFLSVGSVVDEYVVTYMKRPIYSSIADNTIQFRICSWYVAISVV